MEPLLAVQNLTVRYRTREGKNVFALTDANLDIARGEVVGVLGESGSGKSTLAVSLLALLPPSAVIDAGAVLLQGANLLKLDIHDLSRVRGSRISLIYQEPSVALHPTMRVGAQIEEVLRAHDRGDKNARRQEARALLGSIFSADADRIYSSYPHQLSGGQRQRIVIAQAIACKPDLLIADEPTAALDSVTQFEILELLKKLQREYRLAMLFITHSLELLSGFADRVVVMYGGRIVEEGRAANLLHSPQHPYTQALMKCRPVLRRTDLSTPDVRLPVIAGDPPDQSTRSEGCPFTPRCPERMQICRERVPETSKTPSGTSVSCFKFGG